MRLNVRKAVVPLWLAVVTAGLGWLLTERASSARKVTEFPEITVQRINIVEPDGKPRVIISSQERMPNAIWRGKEYAHRSHGGGGFLFFNNDGTEAGGMGFASQQSEDGFGAVSNLNFDQYNQDNTLQLIYTDNNGKRTAGLRVNDRPNESLLPALELIDRIASAPNEKVRSQLEAQLQKMTEKLAAGQAVRFFAGKEHEDAIVRLTDKQGRPRLVLRVSGDGAATIEFLDEAGTVVNQVQPRSR